jgi:ATP-dependent Clp protease ATP-binding subunit ClpC
MATLHVRNVPEPLYEGLRRCAEANGRSIGAQAIALLNESLSAGRRGFPFFGPRARGASTPFQSFDEEARIAVVDAQAIVRELGQDHVGTDHLLLAIVSNRGSAVAQALSSPPLNVTPDAVRARLERGSGVPKGSIPFSAETKQALELALRESLQLRSTMIDSTHLMLGIAAAGGPGAAVLAELGVGMDALRLAALTLPAPGPVPGFKVVELRGGSAADWEDMLNEAASGPYELVQIAGRRAIFQLRRP